MTRSDTGPFVVLPVWVLDLPIPDYALRVYAVHADWADRQGADHWHTRKKIAERVRCSLDAVDKANKLLVEAGALEVERRRDAAGDPTSNRYIVKRVPPGGVAAPQRLPSRSPAATGSRQNTARIKNQFETTLTRDARAREATSTDPVECTRCDRRARFHVGGENLCRSCYEVA